MQTEYDGVLNVIGIVKYLLRLKPEKSTWKFPILPWIAPSSGLGGWHLFVHAA
jgi:hypothetical protein